MGSQHYTNDARLGTQHYASTYSLGNKEYELTDHLHTVRATLTDDPTSTSTDAYPHASDYLPYGNLIATAGSGSYQYGYNGWQKNNEEESADNYTTTFRQYDGQIGRYTTVDPLAMAMPSYSPYNHAVGNPIKFVDKEGDGPSPSNWLAKAGVSLPPLAAGLIDGIAGASFLGTASMVYDLATDPKFRNDMINAFKAIACDPVGFLGSQFTEYKDLLTRVANGKATPADMKRLGEEIGGYLAGAVGGGAITKILGKVKAFQKLKTQMDAVKKKVLGKGETPILDCPLCFTELTKVQTSKGFKDIKDIAIGDSVWSFNENSGLFSFERVIEKHKRIADTIVKVFALGTAIETTTEHPFMVQGKWLRAIMLKAGMALTLSSTAQVPIDSVKFLHQKTDVYNFTVQNNSTYTIGYNGILVHNCGPKLKTPGGATIRNGKLAGKNHPVTGVKFDKDGFPDFSKHIYSPNGKPVDVNIGNLTGDVVKDEAAALAKAGLKSTPPGYTWHHHQDVGRMQLVKTDIHNKTGHTGGVKLYEEANGVKYKRK